MTTPSDISLLFGRLHPLLVHLPIGLIVLLAILEFIARWPRFKSANSNAGFILALAAPLAIVTVVCGWLLSLGGGYEPKLLQWHKWAGIGTTAVCLIAGLLHWLNLRKAYLVCLFSSFAALTVASHFGGSLTHGSDYLVRYAPEPLRTLLGAQPKPQMAKTQPEDFTQRPAFATLIQPLLQENCVSCHGPEKSKGKLRLDSHPALLKGGDSGPAIAAGKSVESDLIKRLLLPLEDENHMPPDGKPQPKPDDIALLQWWIDSGAPADKKIAEMKPPANISRIIAARSGVALPAVVVKTTPPKARDEALALATPLANELNVPLTALSQSDPWLQCNASIAGTNFGDAQLAKLAPVALNLRWLDLGGTGVTDAGLAQLAAMPNLKRLHLERTAITDAGLQRLNCLSDLEYLNLYGTEVTDAGLTQLQAIPKLKQVYLWQTKVTPAAAKAFAEARVDQGQLQRWKEEIEQLQTKIRDQHLLVDLGITERAAGATNVTPVNASCPVSGKPIDSTKTVLYEGTLVAFCCDDCKAKFQQDPKPYLEKLKLPTASTEQPRIEAKK